MFQYKPLKFFAEMFIHVYPRISFACFLIFFFFSFCFFFYRGLGGFLFTQYFFLFVALFFSFTDVTFLDPVFMCLFICRSTAADRFSGLKSQFLIMYLRENDDFFKD